MPEPETLRRPTRLKVGDVMTREVEELGGI
jgi:hypothetical protein